MKTLIRGGIVVSPQHSVRADVLIEHGIITAVGGGLSALGARVVDAQGCFVLPGFVDAHTHLQMESAVGLTADSFESGTRAAVFGGTTTIVDFATQFRGETLSGALESWHGKARSCYCNYGFHMAITDWNDVARAEIPQMVQSGVTTFKVYLAYDALRLSDAQVFELMCRVRQSGGMVAAHCENGDLVNQLTRQLLNQGQTQPSAHPLSRPDWVEEEAINRFLTIAASAKCPAHIVHLTTQKGLEIVRKWRARGLEVYVETCPQYLALTDERYGLPDFEGAKYVCSPPLRKQADVEALWRAVEECEIDTLATDHCAYQFHGQKDAGRENFSAIPNGMPGLETRAQIVYTHGVCTGRINMQQFCALMSTQPAHLFGMPQKGVVAVGADADIVLWEPDFEQVISRENQHDDCDYTPYEGMAVRGRARDVFVGGEPVIEQGSLTGNQCGKFVPRMTGARWR